MTSQPHVVALLILFLLLSGSPRTARGQDVSACPGAGSSLDADRDGLTDECELALARRFAPELLVDPQDCLFVPGRRLLAGGYLFTVDRSDGGGIRISYLPAWYRDCGWRGLQGILRLGRTSAHAGDSEIIALNLVGEASGWRVAGVFLSAHCGGSSAGRCRWFRGAQLEEFRWTGGPQVWVARDKHAGYPSRSACESGHWFQERCAHQPVPNRFPVLSPSQNIGSRGNPGHAGEGCIRSEDLPLRLPGATSGTIECLWSQELPFRGWQHDRGEATTYGVVLQRLDRP